MLPTPTGLTLVNLAPTQIDLQFTGVAGADHYDIYRSSDPTDVGSKINVNPIPQTALPFTETYSDNSTNSTIAPAPGNVYFYRAVAVDSLGNISVPSIALEVLNEYPPLLTPEAPIVIEVQERGS